MKEMRRRSLKWMMFAFIVNIVLGVLWMFVAIWLMRHSSNHSWLSSFVEIAFALNVAVSIRRIVVECIKPTQIYVRRKIDEQINSHSQKLAKDVFSELKERADVALSRFGCEELPRLKWCERLSAIAAASAIVMLLGYDEAAQWLFAVPALLLPPIWFFSTYHLLAVRAFFAFVDGMNVILRRVHHTENKVNVA